MASIGELSVFISAETARAKEALRQVDLVANKSTKSRSVFIGADTQKAVADINKVDEAASSLNKNLSSTNATLKKTSNSFDAGKLSQEFIYLNKRVERVKESVSELRETLKLVGAQKVVDIADAITLTLLARINPELFQEQITQGIVEGVKAGANKSKDILYRNFFSSVSEGISDGINTLARIGFAGQGLLFIVQPIKAAFEGLFNFTLGQNIKLQDTILATATTLATTADVIAANGDKIVDPFERIKALQGPVEDAIDSIRERSLKLAGVTSSQVIDVFSVVATSIGQINGSLKDAEDLAIAFTASLGTLGIPLFQARQEVGSILGGYITEDSLLARRLGITNQQVREAKTQSGGITKFLLDKLSTAEAGQEILAKGFRGVTSNIAELFELIGLAVGKPLLDPLVNSLNAAFEVLFKFKQLLTDVGQLISGTLVRAFQVAFEPFVNSKYVQNLGKQFKAITEPLKELQNITKGDKGSFLERAIIGTNPDKVPQVLQGTIKGLRSIKNEIMLAARSAGDPIKRILTDERADTGFSNPMPQRIASLPLLDPTVFNQGWDTVTSTLEEVTKAFGKFAFEFAKFKIREVADYIRLLADTINALGLAFLGAANFVASFANLVSTLLQMPLIRYFNQLRLATQLVGISDFVDNLRILTIVGLGVYRTMQSVTFAFDNFQKGVHGIALAAKVAAGGMTATTTALHGLSMSGRIFAVGGDITARVMDKLGTVLGYTSAEIEKCKKNFGTMDSAMKVVKSTMRSLLGQMLMWNVAFIGINLLLGFLITTFSNWMEEQRKARREAELLNKVTNTTADQLIKLQNSADPNDQRLFTKSIRETEEAMAGLGETIDEDMKKLDELNKKYKHLETKEMEGVNDEHGVLLITPGEERRGLEYLQKQLELQNKIETLIGRRRFEAYRWFVEKREELEKKIEGEKAKYEALDRKKKAVLRAKELKKEASLMGKRRTDLEKKIAKFRTDLNREIANREFSARMNNDRRRAQAELEAAKLRIRIDKKRALELLEGEEGAAAEAKRNLALFIAQRETAEAERQQEETEFTIKIAELTRDLENYKLGIQEKITEMQKKVGEYQTQVANYLERKAKNEAVIRAEGAQKAKDIEEGATGRKEGITGLREGTTGTSTGNHFHIEGVGFTPSEAGVRAIFAEDIRRQLVTKDVPGMREQHPVTGEPSYHAGYDLAGPVGIGQGLPLNLAKGYAVTKFERDVGGYGNQATVTGPDGVQYTVSHLADPGPDFKLPGAGAPSTPLTVNEIPVPEFPDLSLGGDTSGLTIQLERTKELEKRLKDTRELIRQADTAEAFNAIADSLYKLPPVERLQNETTLLKEKLRLIREIEDPERLNALSAIEKERLVTNREYEEARAAVIKEFGEGSQELEDFDKRALARKDKFLKKLEDQEEITLSLIDLQKQLSIASDMKALTKQNRLNVNKNLITSRAALLASTEYSAFDQQRILAEGRIETERLDREAKYGGPLEGEALAMFEEFKKSELVNAEKLAEIQILQEKFQDLGKIASDVGTAISNVFTEGFADIVSGAASVQDVLGNMFKRIADSFMQMAQKIIAEMLKMYIFKQLVNIFNPAGAAASSGPTEVSSIDFGTGAKMWDAQFMEQSIPLKPFATGGIVTGPTPALIGEGGLNEAVVPLPNGKSIPVDFGGTKLMQGNVTSNVTVNVENNGDTSSTLTGSEAGKLGKAIDTAVRRVIMEEKRAGGLLQNGRR